MNRIAIQSRAFQPDSNCFRALHSCLLALSGPIVRVCRSARVPQSWSIRGCSMQRESMPINLANQSIGSGSAASPRVQARIFGKSTSIQRILTQAAIGIASNMP